MSAHAGWRPDRRYTFSVGSNDGSRLVINGHTVVDNDGAHYYAEKEGSIMLESGRHELALEYFHKNGKVGDGGRGAGRSGAAWLWGFVVCQLLARSLTLLLGDRCGAMSRYSRRASEQDTS